VRSTARRGWITICTHSFFKRGGFGGGGGDQLDDHPIADKGLGTPVLADEGEQAGFDFVPLAVRRAAGS
jgi:hypothetical protein